MKKTISVVACALIILLFFLGSASAQDKYSKIIVTSKAIEALGKIGDPLAAETVMQGLKSKEFFIKAYSAQAAGALGLKEAVPALKGLQDDENYLVRVFAAKALYELGQTSAQEILLSYLEDEDAAVRAVTIEELGKFKERYLPKIAAVLSEEPVAAVRVKALQVLGKNKYIPATPLVIEAMNDPYPLVRQAACNALALISEGHPGTVTPSRTASPNLKYLAKKINDDDPLVRASAIEGLTHFGEVKGSYRIKVKKGNRVSITRLDKELWERLGDKDPLVKTSSYLGLAKLKDVRVVPDLIREITAPSSPTSVKKGSARALRIIKPHVLGLAHSSIASNRQLPSANLQATFVAQDKDLILTIVDALEDPKNPLHSDTPVILEQLSEPLTFPALRHALYQDNPDIVANVAYVLGELRDKGAVNDLMKVAKQYGI